MTYHFAGIEPLLTEAFTQWAHTIADHFLVVLSAARTPAEAQAAVVDIVIGTQWATPLNLLLSHELYAHGARHPAMKQVMRNWMARSREALERHFDPLTARALDAFIEGMTLHHAVDPWPGGRAGVEEMVGRLCGSAQAARL